MTEARLTHIVRHPVKSLGYQELTAAALSKGRLLPFDRHWAIATEGAPFSGAPEGWVPKMAFVRGVAEGTLQAISARFDEATGHLVLSHPARADFIGHLPHDAAALIDWVRPLWPATRPAPARLVSRQDGGALSDVPEGWISVLNLASNRDLGDRMGRDLSIHRWRGNLWLDGLAPWQENDLIGRDIQIAGVHLRVEARITRCLATTFDPVTGAQDGDTLTALKAGWGHQDFGIYARVLNDGNIALGDRMSVLA